MLTKKEIAEQLRQMGVQPTDTVLIHTSLKAVGEVEGGAEGFIDAFCAYLADGLFIVPTHTWAAVNADNPVYDVRTAVPCIGVVPKVAAFRPDGIRSLHPTHSVWACGKGAAAYVDGEENAGSPGAPGFCWDQLADRHAKILLIGVKHDRDTFIHSVDEYAGVENRLGKPFEVTITDHNGQEMKRMFRPHGCSRTNDVSQFYVNFEKPLVALGAQTFGRLGNAEVRVVDAYRCREILAALYHRENEAFFTEFREIPEALYMDL